MKHYSLITLIFAASMTMALPTQGDAVEVSRISLRSRIFNPFTVSRYSRLTVDSYGLPTYTTEEAPANIFLESAEPIVVTEISVSEELEIVSASTSSRPPYRPRVRSPFRPPPRP